MYKYSEKTGGRSVTANKSPGLLCIEALMTALLFLSFPFLSFLTFLSTRLAHPHSLARLHSPMHRHSHKERTRQPLRHIPNLPPQLSIIRRRPGPGHATPIAKRVRHIIKRQNPITGIIAPLRNKVDGHAPTRTTPMLQQRVRQSPHRAQIQRRAGLQVLRKHADAAFADTAAETEGAADAGVGGGTVAAGRDARIDAAADGDGLGLRDADDVVAVVVGGRVGVGVGPDGVAEGLDDGFGGLVVPGGAGAEAGAAAIDAEGCGGGGEEEGEGGDADDGV